MKEFENRSGHAPSRIMHTLDNLYQWVDTYCATQIICSPRQMISALSMYATHAKHLMGFNISETRADWYRSEGIIYDENSMLYLIPKTGQIYLAPPEAQ